MKKRIAIFLLILGTSPIKNASAGHITGGEITYAYTGTPNLYLVTLKLFHDCQGIPTINPESICVSSATCGINFMHTVNQIGSQELLQSACTIPGVSSCMGGPVPGVEEVTYMDTVTLTGPCTDWIFSYSICCMMPNTLSGSHAVYIEARLNNVLAPTGSSPTFNNAALPRFCLYNYSQYNFGCTDVDGDLLNYSFESCSDASGFCPFTTLNVSYLIPYSSSNPLSSSIPITLSTSGLMEFTPNVIQTAVIKVRVMAVAGGGITGSIMRQNIVTIVNGIVGVPDLPVENFNIEIFPNVSGAIFNYSVPQNFNGKLNIEIFNAFGKIVFSQKSAGVTGEFNSLDLANFPPGIYMVSFSEENKRTVKRIIKL